MQESKLTPGRLVRILAVSAVLAVLIASHGRATADPPAAKPADAAKTMAGGAKEAEPFPLVESLYILVLAGFLGFEVIGRVSPLLHTPLMSATNAISGISLVGSLVIAGNESGKFSNPAAQMLGLLAVTTAMINVVGGFHDHRPDVEVVQEEGGSR